MDADNELVTLNSDEDLQTAVLSSKAEQIKTLKVYILPQKGKQASCFIPEPTKITEKTGENVKSPISPKEVPQRGKGSSFDPSNPSMEKFKKSLTYNDLNAIDGFIGLKIQKAVEENVKSILPGLMAKFQEQQVLENEQMNIFAQSMTNANKLRMSEKKAMKEAFEDVCNECFHGIQGVKYSCLHCPDYKCCEECENKIEHAHPLLKIKISIHTRPPAKSAHGKINYKFNFNISPEKAKRLSEGGVYLKKTLHRAPNKVLYAGRVTFDKNTEKLVKANPCEKYKINVYVKNTGKESWPEDIKLCCVNGIYRNQEQKLLPLEPGAKQTICLDLEAPSHQGKYLSQWKLYYNEEEKQKSFGESLFLELQVEGNQRNESMKNGMVNVETWGFPKTRSLAQVSSSSEGKIEANSDGVSSKRFKVAKYLNEIFPGKLQEKMKFVNKYSDGEVQDMSKIVELYLINLSRVGTSRGCKSQEGYNNETPQMSLTL